MIIQNDFTPKIKYNTETPKKRNSNNIAFSGHTGLEHFNNEIGMLIHETRFFRDFKTKNYVKQYIEKFFKDKPEINIMVGGCSTGEEAITYSMMLNDLRNKVKIIGFDLSPTSIKEAKSGKFIMQYCKNEDLVDKLGIITNQDGYLWRNIGKPLNEIQKRNKELFDNFLKPLNEKPPQSLVPLSKRLYNFYLRLTGVAIPKFENKYYGLRYGKAANTDFVVGDIKKIDEIEPNKKMDVITFSNSLYHLTSEFRNNNRYSKWNLREILSNVTEKISPKLNKNGLFVVGEREHFQIMDSAILAKVMKEDHGFEVIDILKNNNPPSIFRKITD